MQSDNGTRVASDELKFLTLEEKTTAICNSCKTVSKRCSREAVKNHLLPPPLEEQRYYSFCRVPSIFETEAHIDRTPKVGGISTPLERTIEPDVTRYCSTLREGHIVMETTDAGYHHPACGVNSGAISVAIYVVQVECNLGFKLDSGDVPDTAWGKTLLVHTVQVERCGCELSLRRHEYSTKESSTFRLHGEVE